MAYIRGLGSRLAVVAVFAGVIMAMIGLFQVMDGWVIHLYDMGATVPYHSLGSLGQAFAWATGWIIMMSLAILGTAAMAVILWILIPNSGSKE